MNQNRLNNTQVVELLDHIKRSPAINTLETLWLNGNSWVEQTSWIALAELIEAAPNLTKLHIKEQGQGGNSVKFELQPASEGANNGGAEPDGKFVVSNQETGDFIKDFPTSRTR